jgi:hypothetical protein
MSTGPHFGAGRVFSPGVFASDTRLTVELDFLVLHSGARVNRDSWMAGMQLLQLSDYIPPLIVEESTFAVVILHIAA